MNPNPDFLALLQCPKTNEGLSFKDNQLVSDTSNENYPLMNGIPWLHPNPLHSMVDWSVKLNHFHKVLSTEITELDKEQKQTSGDTQARLKMLMEGKHAFLHQVTDLVSPIVTTKVASKPIYDALSDRAPNTQNLLSYEANVYRDWVWGEEENQQSCELIANVVGDTKVGNMMVVGAGACKLAYDLHNVFKPAHTIANDINPLLMFSAQRILFGEGLEIVEFPMQPKTMENVVVKHTIPAVENSPTNFHLLFADAAKPALKAKCINTLVTPWVIDIQPYELSVFLNALNHYLDIGGTWINFGSLVFNQGRDALCYSIEEVKSIAETCGFEIEHIEQKEMPYLKSPYNAGWRMENLWCWRAVKVKGVAHEKEIQHLPTWLIDTSQHVPLTKELQGHAFAHKTYAEVMSLVDGNHSLQQMGRKFARKKNMDEQEAIAMLKSFYKKLLNLN